LKIPSKKEFRRRGRRQTRDLTGKAGGPGVGRSFYLCTVDWTWRKECPLVSFPEVAIPVQEIRDPAFLPSESL
jgi:hypothetical protein